MESAGAVFLPAAGYRNGTDMSLVEKRGAYWSATPLVAEYACYLDFVSYSLRPQDIYNRFYGLSVRLVR
jgi:hypothetical protein